LPPDPVLGTLEGALGEVLARVSTRFELVSGFSVHGAAARISLRSPHAAVVRAAALSAGGAGGVEGFHGLLLASTGMAPDTINVHPPFVISASELEIFEELLMRTFARAEEAIRG
jgi:hypothetical protein